MSVAFVVEGRPVPQGSMVGSYDRKHGTVGIHHANGTALATWRADIRREAKAAGAILLPNAIAITMIFGMPRPKAHMHWKGGKLVPKMQYYYARPTTAPDIDKLVRAVLDALTGTCYPDDSQVVAIYATKVYADTTFIEVDSVDDSAQQSLSAWMESDPKARPS